MGNLKSNEKSVACHTGQTKVSKLHRRALRRYTTLTLFILSCLALGASQGPCDSFAGRTSVKDERFDLPQQWRGPAPSCTQGSKTCTDSYLLAEVQPNASFNFNIRIWYGDYVSDATADPTPADAEDVEIRLEAKCTTFEGNPHSEFHGVPLTSGDNFALVGSLSETVPACTAAGGHLSPTQWYLHASYTGTMEPGDHLIIQCDYDYVAPSGS